MSETKEGTTMLDDRDTMTLLAHALVERRAYEDPWHELATGVLTREQVIAMRRDLEPPEQLERKLLVFEPPPAEVGDRILDELLRQHAEPDQGEPEADQGEPEADQGEPEAVDEDDRVVPLRARTQGTRRGWLRSALVGATALAAAVLLTWMLQPAPSGPSRLPAFELELDDGWSGPLRGADGAIDSVIDRCDQRYHQEGSLTVRLHPSEALGDDLSVAAFAQPEAGEGRWIAPRALAPRVSDQGVVSIEQPVAELQLSPGIWVLTFYVVRKGEQPELAALRALEPGAHPGVTVVRGSVCIVE